MRGAGEGPSYGLALDSTDSTDDEAWRNHPAASRRPGEPTRYRAALRDELRNRNLLPILFDFSIPASRDVTETVKTLASLARFVIADVTDATEVRVELHKIVPDLPSLPIQLILLRGHPEFVSLSHLTKFPRVLPNFEYDHSEHLLASLDKIIIAPEAKVKPCKRP